VRCRCSQPVTPRATGNIRPFGEKQAFGIEPQSTRSTHGGGVLRVVRLYAKIRHFPTTRLKFPVISKPAEVQPAEHSAARKRWRQLAPRVPRTKLLSCAFARSRSQLWRLFSLDCRVALGSGAISELLCDSALRSPGASTTPVVYLYIGRLAQLPFRDAGRVGTHGNHPPRRWRPSNSNCLSSSIQITLRPTYYRSTLTYG
jgi:hypothetical protein